MPAAPISLKREKKKQGEGGAKKKKHGKRKRTGAHSGPSLKPAIIQCGVIVSVEVEEETVQGAARPSGAEFAEEQDSWESSRPFFFLPLKKQTENGDPHCDRAGAGRWQVRPKGWRKPPPECGRSH